MAIAGHVSQEHHSSPARILALDGGGVRGLSSLLILRELMTRVATRTGEKIVRPCDYFELIIGTGTGGISALFLGRMKMTVDQAIEEYLRVAENAFKPKSWINNFFPSQVPLLDGSPLQQTIADIVERFTSDRNAKLADPPSEGTRQCRTAVLAATSHAADAPPYIFQSYIDDRPASAFTICEVARATSSTAGLFEPVMLGSPALWFTDAGVSGYNNPSEAALERLYPGRSVELLVSLGTGLRKITRLQSKKSKIAKACRALMQNCEIVHDRLQRRLSGKESYFRFNVNRGLEDIDLMEWNEAGPNGKLSSITDSYMRWVDVEMRLQSCVMAIGGNKHKGIRERSVSFSGPQGSTLSREHRDIIKSHAHSISAPGKHNYAGEAMSKQRSENMMRTFMPTHNPCPEIFHGRRDEVEKAISLIQSNESTRIAVLGAGGIGKTSIALAILHDSRVGVKYKSHRRFLTCEGLNTPAQLVATLCTAFGIEDRSTHRLEDLLAILTEQYSSSPLLIVLDNFEAIWDTEGAQLEAQRVLRALGNLPSLSLILTMRGAEQPVWIRWSWVLNVSTLDRDAARSTFMDVRSRDHVNDERLDELLQAVDYVPLAVTLLGRLGQNESPAALLERWTKEPALLSRPQDKHRSNSVSVSIQISIEGHRMKSNPGALRLLSVISILPAGVSREDLPLICSRISNWAEASTTLREVGLAYHDAASFLRALSPIRTYVREHHPISVELLQDVRSFYFTLTRQALQQPPGPDLVSGNGVSVVMNLTRNAPNIEAVITEALTLELQTRKKVHWQSVEAAINWTRFTLTTNPRTTIIELGLKVARDRTARGEKFHSYPSRRVELIQNGPGEVEQAMAAPESGTDILAEGISELNSLADGVFGEHGDGNTGILATQITRGAVNINPEDDVARDGKSSSLVPWERPKHFFVDQLGDCLYSLGDIKRIKSEFSAAKSLLLEARDKFRTIKSDFAVAKCLWSLGDTYIGTSMFDLARESLKEAATAFKSLDLRSWLAWCDLSLGRIQYITGYIDSAEETFSNARDAFILENDPLGHGECLWSLGDIHLRKSEYKVALRHFTEALVLFKAVDHRFWIAVCLLHLGTTQRLISDYDGALNSIAAAWEIWRGLKDPRGAAFAHFSLTKLQRAKGEFDAAKVALVEVMRDFQSLNDQAIVVECHMDLADIHIATKQFDAARKSIARASVIFRFMQNGAGMARCKLTCGRLRMAEHKFDRARESFAEAYDEFAKQGIMSEAGECLWNLGDIYLAKSEYYIAREYFRGGLNIFKSVGNRLWISECLISLGNSQGRAGQYNAARENLCDARREFEALDDRRGISRTLYSLVNCAKMSDDLKYARGVLVEASGGFKAIDDRHGLARCSWELAVVHIKAFDYAAAREVLDKSIAAFENLEDMFWLTRCHISLGRIQLFTGELDAAHGTLVKAQRELLRLPSGDALGMGECLFNIAEIHLRRSEGKAASDALTDALDIFISHSEWTRVAECNYSLGHAHRIMDRYDAARDYFTKARENFKSVHDFDGADLCTAALASIQSEMFRLEWSKVIVIENLKPAVSMESCWYPGLGQIF